MTIGKWSIVLSAGDDLSTVIALSNGDDRFIPILVMPPDSDEDANDVAARIHRDVADPSR